MAIFFYISLVTNILAPLIPDVIKGFSLSLSAAGVLPFAFFIAYGVLSIPSGMLAERFSDKTILLVALGLALVGSLSFALRPAYASGVASLFVIGGGFAMAQVVINPLLRVAGGERHFAFNSTAAQMVFGAASFLSPGLSLFLVARLREGGHADGDVLRTLARVVPANLPWVSLYWVFAALTLIMMAVIAVVRFPAIARTAEETAGSWRVHARLFRSRVVILYFVSIFAYVGCEQGTTYWMAQFLATYHGYGAEIGATAVSRFWGLMTLGCLAGLVPLKLFDSRKVLLVCSGAAIVSLSAALFGPGPVAVLAFPAIGLFVSVMWPLVMSLALNSVTEHHGSVAGILCTGIAGGATAPLVIGGWAMASGCAPA